MKTRTALKAVRVNDDIANRYYQKKAIQSVYDAFGTRNRRKALLVMVTESGKTRTRLRMFSFATAGSKICCFWLTAACW